TLRRRDGRFIAFLRALLGRERGRRRDWRLPLLDRVRHLDSVVAGNWTLPLRAFPPPRRRCRDPGPRRGLSALARGRCGLCARGLHVRVRRSARLGAPWRVRPREPDPPTDLAIYRLPERGRSPWRAHVRPLGP